VRGSYLLPFVSLQTLFGSVAAFSHCGKPFCSECRQNSLALKVKFKFSLSLYFCRLAFTLLPSPTLAGEYDCSNQSEYLTYPWAQKAWDGKFALRAKYLSPKQRTSEQRAISGLLPNMVPSRSFQLEVKYIRVTFYLIRRHQRVLV